MEHGVDKQIGEVMDVNPTLPLGTWCQRRTQSEFVQREKALQNATIWRKNQANAQADVSPTQFAQLANGLLPVSYHVFYESLAKLAFLVLLRVVRGVASDGARRKNPGGSLLFLAFRSNEMEGVNAACADVAANRGRPPLRHSFSSEVDNTVHTCDGCGVDLPFGWRPLEGLDVVTSDLNGGQG